MKTVNYNKKGLEFNLRILENDEAVLTWLSHYNPPADDDAWFWEDLQENVNLLIQNDLSGEWKIIEKWENHGRNGVRLERENDNA